MLQYSKVINSRNKWKSKAVQRADEIRELKKTRKRLKEKIAELKVQNQGAKQAPEHEHEKKTAKLTC